MRRAPARVASAEYGVRPMALFQVVGTLGSGSRFRTYFRRAPYELSRVDYPGGSAFRRRTEVARLSECWFAHPVRTRRYPTQLGSPEDSDKAVEGLRELLVLKREQTQLISYL